MGRTLQDDLDEQVRNRVKRARGAVEPFRIPKRPKYRRPRVKRLPVGFDKGFPILPKV